MIKHVILFIIIGWLLSLAYFTREAESPKEALILATRKLIRYSLWAILFGVIVFILEKIFIYPY